MRKSLYKLVFFICAGTALNNTSSIATADDSLTTSDELILFYTPFVADDMQSNKVEGMDDSRGLAGVRKGNHSNVPSTSASEETEREILPNSATAPLPKTTPAKSSKSFLNILFDVDSAIIAETSYPQLAEIGKALESIMLDYPSATFIIEGHTDSSGASLHNQYLSLKRARSIKSYLLQRFELDDNRITAIGYGEEQPVASNNSSTGRKLNRRVEITGY